MAKVGTVDKFANTAYIKVTETAANTLTFKRLDTGIAIFEKVAWLIGRVEYFFDVFNATNFNGTGDQVSIALTVSNTIADLGLGKNEVIDAYILYRQDLGTAASGFMLELPYVKDFTNLPGGGMLIPPNPLFLGIKGTGLAAATSCEIRLYYTILQLSPDQYWELVESRRMISST